jgi:DNA polymerase III delta prime subunit
VHAYLLITNGGGTRQKAQEIVPEARRIIPYTLATIADTKELIRQTSISFPEKTIYLLENIDHASIEAQNAFLKSLEEAQENLTFILTTKSEEAVLPTIVSRCQVIRPRKMPSASRGGVKVDFETISKISKREEAVDYLENLINALEPELPKKSAIVKAADKALTRIKANANPTLQLTWFMAHI